MFSTVHFVAFISSHASRLPIVLVCSVWSCTINRTFNSQTERSCCLVGLKSNDDNIELAENSFSESGCRNEEEEEEEELALFYIPGYDACQEGLGADAPENADDTDSEFLVENFPILQEICLISLYCYTFFESQIREK